VYLNYTFISGNGLEGLKDATQLNTLEMNATTVSDENVAIIGQLKNLRNLSWTKTILPIPGFVPCHTLTIFDLALTGTGIGDKAIGCIKQYRDLVQLSLEDVKIDDPGGQQIAEIPTIEDLVLKNTGIGDATLVALKRLRRLRSLSIPVTKVTDEGMKS
jgi:hypothetical protein